MKQFFLVLFAALAIIAPSFAATINVDTTMTDQAIISSIEGAQAGDEVVIQPGTYRVRLYLQQHGSVENRIIIRGSDPANRPVFDYTGQEIGLWPGTATGWFAYYAIVNQGNYVTMQDIVVRGARRADYKSAGVYNGPMGTAKEPAAAGSQPLNFILKNVEITDCDDGISSTGINTTVDTCYLHGNGIPNKTTGRHNAYIHGGTITFQNTVFDNAVSGQHLTSRAQMTVVDNCTFGTVGSYPFLMNTPKADMAKGVFFEQNYIIRNSEIAGVRQNGLGISKVFEAMNGNNYSGLKQYVALENNVFTGAEGNTSSIVYLNRASGTIEMGATSTGNTYTNYGAFLRLNPGEDVNNSFYKIDVQDVSDASLPDGSGTVPVDPPAENNINFVMTWNQADTANLHGWLIWSTTDQTNWGEPKFVEYVEGMVFQSSASLPVADEYFFRIKPVNVLMQEGEGADTSVSLDVALPGPTTEFIVVIE